VRVRQRPPSSGQHHESKTVSRRVCRTLGSFERTEPISEPVRSGCRTQRPANRALQNRQGRGSPSLGRFDSFAASCPQWPVSWSGEAVSAIPDWEIRPKNRALFPTGCSGAVSRDVHQAHGASVARRRSRVGRSGRARATAIERSRRRESGGCIGLERRERLQDEGDEHLRAGLVRRIRRGECRGEVLLFHGCRVVEVAAQDRHDDQADQVGRECRTK
jgi:hypothetical protein